MQARAVFLVGFMGSGKNTVGRELARRLNWNFVDLDAQIEAREGQTIPEIFNSKGEGAFRNVEAAALRDVLRNSLSLNSVVALGGGTFVSSDNRALLRDWPTVFLDAPINELWHRCQQNGTERPLAKDHERFARLHAERLPFYRQAKLTVRTEGKQLPSICSEIENWLHPTETPENLKTGESQ